MVSVYYTDLDVESSVEKKIITASELIQSQNKAYIQGYPPSGVAVSPSYLIGLRNGTIVIGVPAWDDESSSIAVPLLSDATWIVYVGDELVNGAWVRVAVELDSDLRATRKHVLLAELVLYNSSGEVVASIPLSLAPLVLALIISGIIAGSVTTWKILSYREARERAEAEKARAERAKAIAEIVKSDPQLAHQMAEMESGFKATVEQDGGIWDKIKRYILAPTLAGIGVLIILMLKFSIIREFFRRLWGE